MTEQNRAPTAASWPRRVGRTLKGFVLWEYERGSWQYDVMVALIVVFVLFTPARYFHNQPVYQERLGGDIVRLGADSHGDRYRVSAELLASYHTEPRQAAEQVLAANLGHPVTIIRIQAIEGAEGEVAWYDVWVRQ